VKTHLFAALCALSIAGCGSRFFYHRDDSCSGQNEIEKPLPSLGHDEKPFEWKHADLVYRFERENSGTTETLRAIVVAEKRPPLVVGDKGIALVRDSKAGWMREATGTTENLNALVFAPITTVKENHTVEKVEPRYIAVGAHGTALVRDQDGVWHSENTGTTADLYAARYRGSATIAAGAGGVMVERSPEGVWHEIQTHTKADLYAMGGCGGYGCAVGAEGAVVLYVPEDGEVKDDLICVPRPPVAKTSLRVVTDMATVLGDGVWVTPVMQKDGDLILPPQFEPWRFAGASVANDEARAASTNHWVGMLEMLVAGRGGAVWLIGNQFIEKEPFQKINVPYENDFNGVHFALVDGFLVGSEGTIVKLGVEGFRPPKICLL